MRRRRMWGEEEGGGWKGLQVLDLWCSVEEGFVVVFCVGSDLITKSFPHTLSQKGFGSELRGA
jgi:hypothetical protein